MIIFPSKVDLTPSGELVKRANMGEEGYADNVEYSLLISPTGHGVVILNYTGEDGSYLTEQQMTEIYKNSTNFF